MGTAAVSAMMLMYKRVAVARGECHSSSAAGRVPAARRGRGQGGAERLVRGNRISREGSAREVSRPLD